MNFDDLVSQFRQRGATDSAPSGDEPGPTSASDPHTDLAATLSRTGLSATMTLASFGVQPVAVGHIKTRFGYEYPEQTSHAWRFPANLYLLRDGTWWQAQNATATAQAAPPPAIRWAMSGDPHSPGTILCPQHELTPAVLDGSADQPSGTLAGRFATTDPRGTPAALYFWTGGGVCSISEDPDQSTAAPFEEWAAAAVAALIDAR